MPIDLRKLNSPGVLFVTGTDTHVGKTFVTCQLVSYMRSLGHRCFAIKPFCSGAPDDVLALQKVNQTGDHPESLNINPYYFEDPLSPYACCLKDSLPFPSLNEATAFVRKAQTFTDILIVEGAGGLHTPIAPQFLLSDLIYTVSDAVLLVVDDKLGCLNHTLLTYNALKNHFKPNELSICITQSIPHSSKNSLNHKILSALYTPETIGFLPNLTKFSPNSKEVQKKIKKPLAVFSEFDRLFVPSAKGRVRKE